MAGVSRQESMRRSIVIPMLAPVTIDEHMLGLEALATRFPASNIDPGAPSASAGMAPEAAAESLRVHGANRVPVPKQPPLVVRYLRQMANLFSLVLFVCGALSLVVFVVDTSMWVSMYTGILFWCVALFNAALEFVQQYMSQRTLEGFLALVPADAAVRRAGRVQSIAVADVAVGDVVLLGPGNKVPADMRVLASESLRMDNSSLTGESEPQERTAHGDAAETPAIEARSLVFSGTIVVSGRGTCVVVRVGAHTVIGRLADFAVTERHGESRLAREMAVLFRRLVVAAAVCATVALVLGFALGLGLPDVFSATIGVAVSFLPQGLPATLTILLTAAAKRMAKRNVLVKELRSVETLGALTLLATDKTGTLTRNEMAVVGAWTGGERVYNTLDEMAGARDVSALARAAVLCTSCRISARGHGDAPPATRIAESGEPAFGAREDPGLEIGGGDATETGVVRFAATHMDVLGVLGAHRRVAEVPFSSARKWHAVVVEPAPGAASPAFGARTLIVKGAPERVLGFCVRLADGTAVDAGFRERFLRMYEYFASNGLRVLAVAVRTVTEDVPSEKECKAQTLDGSAVPVGDDAPSDKDTGRLGDTTTVPCSTTRSQSEAQTVALVHDLTFLGMVCLRDPPKDGVHWAVGRLRDAGIAIAMVTGDHPLTAEAIARQVGILSATSVFRRPPTATDVLHRPECRAAVVHGDTIDGMTQSDWTRLAALDELVFARTAPRHKLEIVKQMQLRGHVVGVSGDGVNDSPALRRADLGISMNRTAADTSKDAAHMILLDDDFCSLVAGVYEGRVIFENVKKSVRYTLTHIMPEVSALLLFSLLLIPLPLSPIVMLAIDVFAELGPAVSFAREPAEYDMMRVRSRHHVQCKENRKKTRPFATGPIEERHSDTLRDERQVDIPRDERHSDIPREERHSDIPRDERQDNIPREERQVDTLRDERQVDIPRTEGIANNRLVETVGGRERAQHATAAGRHGLATERPSSGGALAARMRAVRAPAWAIRGALAVHAAFSLPATGEALVDTELVCWSFFQGGIINAAGAWGAYVLALVVWDVSLGTIYRSSTTYWMEGSPPLLLANGTYADADAQISILGRVQAAYFVAVVMSQALANLWMQKHRWRQPWGRDMLTNWSTYAGMASAGLVVAVVAYIPALNRVFVTEVPPALALAPPGAACVFLVLYEVARRWLRAHGRLGGVPSPVVLRAPSRRGEGVERPRTDDTRHSIRAGHRPVR